MRKPDPVEIVAVAIPILTEALAAMFAVGVACLWVAIYATRMPV